MSRVAFPADFHRAVAISPDAAPAKSGPGLLRRLIDWMVVSRERQAHRDIDRLVRWRDGCFNDSLEREIAAHFYSDGGNFRR